MILGLIMSLHHSTTSGMSSASPVPHFKQHSPHDQAIVLLAAIEGRLDNLDCIIQELCNPDCFQPIMDAIEEVTRSF